MWTSFYDMHSGGGSKEDYEMIYIEAPEDEAVVVFFNRFGHSPRRVSCSCCGADYSVSESETFELASQYHREGKTVDEYKLDNDVLVIPKENISDDEKKGDVPDQGYVWVD